MELKTNQNKLRKDYESPSQVEQIFFTEGVLCTSVPGAGVDNVYEDIWGEF